MMNLNKKLLRSTTNNRCQKRLVLLAIGNALLFAGCNRSSSTQTNQISSNLNRSSSAAAPINPNLIKLYKAIQAGELTQTRQLIKDHPQLLQTQGPLGTPLHFVVDGKANLEMAKVLLEGGADVNVRDKRGNTPLNIAVRGRGKDAKTRVVQLLLSHGADANQGRPLHAAAFTGDVAVVKLLLSHKAAVNAVDKQGDTPLQSVLKSQAKLKAGDKNFKTLSKFFDMKNYPEIIKLLRQAGGK